MIYSQYLRLNLHVSASAKELVKEAHKLLSEKGKSAACRHYRHEWLRELLRYHRREQQWVVKARLLA